MDKRKVRRAALYLALAVVMAVFGYLSRNYLLAVDGVSFMLFELIAMVFFPAGAVAMAVLAVIELIRSRAGYTPPSMTVLLLMAYGLCLLYFLVRWDIVQLEQWDYVFYATILLLPTTALLVLCLALRRLFYQKKICRLLLTLVIFAACVTPLFAHGYDLHFLLHRQRMTDLSEQVLAVSAERWANDDVMWIELPTEDENLVNIIWHYPKVIWYYPEKRAVFFPLAGGWYDKKGYIYYAADSHTLQNINIEEDGWRAQTGGYWLRWSNHDIKLDYSSAVSWPEFFSAALAQ